MYDSLEVLDGIFEVLGYTDEKQGAWARCLIGFSQVPSVGRMSSSLLDTLASVAGAFFSSFDWPAAFLFNFCPPTCAAWQVMGSIGGIHIDWPEEFKKVARVFRTIKVSFDVPSVACALSQTMNYTFYTRLLGYTLFPPGLIAVMALPTLWAMARQLDLKDRLLGMFIRRALFVLFLVHPMVSEVVLSGLVCTDLAYDGKYLKYDTRIDCNSAEYAAYWAFALSMVVVWVLGYPVLILGLLFYYKVPTVAARKQRRAKLGAFLTHTLRLESLPSCEGASSTQPDGVPNTTNLLALLARVFRVVTLGRQCDSVTGIALGRRASTAAERDRAADAVDSLEELDLTELCYLARLHGLGGVSALSKEQLLRGLDELMKELIDSQEIAVPVVTWDRNSPDPEERCACDRLGQIFMAYEARWWWYARARSCLVGLDGCASSPCHA
jgi:hypothetical protein